jgi:hypothetical protein
LTFHKTSKLDPQNPLILTPKTFAYLFIQQEGDDMDVTILKKKMNRLLEQISLHDIISKYLTSISENIQEDALASLEMILGTQCVSS